MKNDWDLKRLGEVSKLINGRAYKKKELLNAGKYPVLRVGNFFTNNNWYYSDLELSEDKYCDSGDLLYAWSASFGPRIWDGGKVIYHYHIWKVEPDYNFVTREYLYWFLEWDTEKIKEEQGTGTTMIHVSKGSMEERHIPLPSKSEQQRIVSIIEEAFEAIKKAEENVRKNLQNSRELFQSYLQSIFTNPGEDWKKKKLGDISVVQSGGTPLKSQKQYWEGGNIPWYSSGELNNLYTNTSQRYITEAGLQNSNAKLFPKGSLLIGMYDTAALKMSILDREAAFNQAIAGVKPNSGLDLIFVLHALNAIKPEVLNLRRGVRQKNLSLIKIKNLNIYIPTISIQKDIVSKLSKFLAETKKLEEKYQQKLTNLDELKQSILQKAFNGEL